MNRFMFSLLALATITVMLSACKSNKVEKTKVVIYTRAPIGSKLTIENISFGDESQFLADSATIKDNHDSLVLFVPKDYERLYRISLSGSRLQMIIINDSKLIRIHVNYFFKKYSIEGSRATASLTALADRRIATINLRNHLIRKVDSLNKLHVKGDAIDSLKSSPDLNIRKLQKDDIAYADTVTSPAAFMEINSLIDFDRDFEGYKKFIIRASNRFPNYRLLKLLREDAIANAKIFEEEYLIGDKLPYITLPDEMGIPYSTSTLNGRYYLIDFWSTWCQQCKLFTKAEYKMLQKTDNVNLAVVSVAMDDQQDAWKRAITKNKFNWIQLIDTKMWEGPAARTLKFDSIPFNFLVSPQGKIIAKAIKPDSLEKVIARLSAN
jgi:thiol-disulfide isomerase/thioredoxin